MIPPGRSATAAIAAALMSVSCATKPSGPLRLVFAYPPAEKTGRAKEAETVGELRFSAPVERLSKTEAVVRPGPFTVSLRFVEGAERAGFVRERLASDTDPFQAVTATRPFVTILMTVRNDADEDLTFNPQGIVIFTDRPSMLPPMDATRAYEEFRAAGLNPDPWMPTLHRVVFDTAVTLKPTEQTSGLLAFRKPDPEVRRARMQFSFWALGMASYSFEIPMVQEPDEAHVPPAAESGPA